MSNDTIRVSFVALWSVDAGGAHDAAHSLQHIPGDARQQHRTGGAPHLEQSWRLRWSVRPLWPMGSVIAAPCPSPLPTPHGRAAT
jgi:hypothetical protein